MQGLPDKDDFMQAIHGCKHTLFFIDDLAEFLTESSFISKLFTKFGHHMGVSTFALVQNMTLPGKYKGNIFKNCHIWILFKNESEMHQLRSIGSCMGICKAFIAIYKTSTKERGGYLVVDRHPDTVDRFKFRSCIIPGQETLLYVLRED